MLLKGNKPTVGCMLDLEEVKEYQRVLTEDYDWYLKKYNYIPKWGSEQTKELNKLVTNNELYNTKSLKKYIEILNNKHYRPDKCAYCIKRWFSAMQAKCDEHLFCLNDGVEKNDDRTGDWDFSVNGVEIDLKSTRFPKELLVNGKLPEDFWTPEYADKLIKYMYEKQSHSREKYNSRLFLIHHSDFGDERTDKLRMMFEKKAPIIEAFCMNVDNHLGWHRWSDKYKNSVSQVLYFVETEKGKLNNKHYIIFKN